MSNDIPTIIEAGREPLSLAGRYLADKEFARLLYGAEYGDDGSTRRVADEVRRCSYDRTTLAGTLRRQNDRWGLSGGIAANIDALERDALVVITGQQTGLFTGPLYTIYKALTAIREARRLSKTLSFPVVPVFWLAADDHDLDEIDHVAVFGDCAMPGDAGSPRIARYRPDYAQAMTGRRVSRIELGPEIDAFLDAELRLLPDGPGRDEVHALIRAAYRPEHSWVDACAMLLARWLGRFGLVLVSPDDADLKRLMGGVFSAEIGDPGASRRAVDERDTAIIAAGYRPQVGRSESSTLLFVDDNAHVRRRVDAAPNGDGFTLADSGESVSTTALRAAFDSAPERVSANALLRPVTGDAVFPTIMHVMGPGEIAYMAQTRGLYERHGIPMPIVAPRASFTIVEPTIEYLIGVSGLDLADASQPVDRWVGILAAKELDERFGETLNGCRRDLDSAYAKLMSEVADELPGVLTAVTSVAVKTQGLANRVSRALEKELRRRIRRTKGDAMRAIGDAVFPLGSPQERVYAIVPYLARYGVDRFMDALESAVQASDD
jgi:bacillithiol synthase